MIEPARRHGPFDPRFQDRAPGVPAIVAEGTPAGLDWAAFSARLGPGRQRHDLVGINAYRAYTSGRSRHPETAPSQIEVAAEPAESEAENEGMPPKPESQSGLALLGQGTRV